MREFIEAIVGDKKLKFKYKDYDFLFIKHDYDSYYLFCFLKDKSQLITLQKEAVEIFNSIKSDKELYKPDMDKNSACIFFLHVTEQEYYEIGENYFQEYKESFRNSYKYDFLINLFIKIPFLSFYEYQPIEEKKYLSMEAFIEKKCIKSQINQNYIEEISNKMEMFDNEDELYEWVDELIERT